MGQKALGQSSDCRILKSNMSLEQTDEITWFFACWYKFMDSKSWVKNIGMGVVNNGYGHSGYRTLKLAVSQGINIIKWFCACE